jgi:type II restriction enzyme
MKISASNLINEINHLDKNIFYNYINKKTKGLIKIQRVDLPEGPIIIRRFDPTKGKTLEMAKDESISSNMLWRVANAIQEDVPINIDRILGASYNTRSVLEALLAHTPNFHITIPGRIEITSYISEIKRGHKHIVWLPKQPHKLGITNLVETERVISEIPTQEAIYEALVVPDDYSCVAENHPIDIEMQRRHAQMQVALVLIGQQLGYRTWVAQNDKGLIYNNKRIGEMENVIISLKDEKLLLAYEDAIKAALLIDCIWFKNGRLMPAVMEIECTTGVNSGLSRMKNFYDKVPPYPTRYVIVAPDGDRNKVLHEGSKKQFADLHIKYFPFSAVEELYSLCQRRKIKGITEEFLDCYMENIA